MPKLFISYAHLDKEIVLQASDELREAGYDVWIDTRGIQGGDFWVEEITDAIIGCDFFLLFISPRSTKSDYVRRELDLAFDNKKKIIPLYLEPTELPTRWKYQLIGIQYINCRSTDWELSLLVALSQADDLEFQRQDKVKTEEDDESPITETGKQINPYSSLPVLEPIEQSLIISNREKERKKALNYLEQHRLLLITGMPGIGKSTFARLLLEYMPAGSPATFWYNFERQKSSGNTLGILLERISSYLDICLNMNVHREVMAFRNSLSGIASVDDVDILINFLNEEKPIWLVFDNLETVLSRETHGFVDENLELLFDSLKNNTHNAKIIITNPFVPIMKDGEPFLEAGTRAMVLEGLDDAFSMAFLRAYDLEEVSDDKLELVVRELNGHPFYLNQTAHYIQAMGITSFLENPQGSLEEVNQRFIDSLQERLSQQEFKTLQALTVLDREMRLNGLCQVAQARPSTIMHLREKGLLQTNNTGYFWLHNIVRNSIRATDPDMIKRAHLQAMSFYRKQELPLSRQSIDDYANVLEWHNHAVEASDVLSAYSALCSTGLKEQLMEWNEYDLLVKLCERTLSALYQVNADLTNVEANLSNSERINIYHILGVAYFLLDDFVASIAHLEVALNLLSLQENRELRIQLLIDLAESYYGAGNYKSARNLCEELEELLSGIKNEALQAKFLHLRVIIHRDQVNPEQTIHDLEEALKIYQDLDDKTHAGSIMLELGMFHYGQNRFEEAIARYRDAINFYQAMNYTRGIMNAGNNIGDIRLQEQKYELAAREFELALNVGQRGKFGDLELITGLGLVEAYIALSQIDEAQKLLDSLDPLLKKSKLNCCLGQKQVLLAYIQLKCDNYPESKRLFLEAFKILKDPGCQYEYARANITFAVLQKKQGLPENARKALTLARENFLEMNNHLGLNAIDRMLADLES